MSDSFTLVRLPVKVLRSRTNGWRDLAMWIQGGGIQPGYWVRNRFDGHHYQSNPSTAPKLSPESATTGTNLKLDATGMPLF